MVGKPKSLRFLKSQLSRIENKAKDLKNTSVYSVRHFLEELESYFLEFSKFYDDEDLTEMAEREYEEYDEKYQSAKSLLMERLDEILQRPPGDALNTSGISEKTLAGLLERQNELFDTLNKISASSSKPEGNRLPYLKIPVFKGDLKDWVRFKNLFVSIVDENRNISSVEKLNHLLSLVDGDALSLIKHYPVTADNYDNAWAALVKEFDNEYLLIRGVIGEVVEAPSLNFKGGSVKTLCTTLAETINALDNLGDYGKSRDPWIIYVITSKFDKYTAKKWAEAMTECPQPDVEFLIEFLQDICSANRIIGLNAPPRFSNPIKGMNATFSGCFVCGEQHKIFQCKRFLKLGVGEREKIVKEKSRCINCLGTGHFSGSCSHKGTCFHCRRRHHSLLHFERSEKQPFKPSGEVKREAEKNKETGPESECGLIKAHLALDQGMSSAILPTAIVELRDSFGRFVKCRALLDCGAQASFIKESFLRKLSLIRSRTRVPIQFMSGSNTFLSKGTVQTIFRSRVVDQVAVSINLHVLPKLTDRLPEKVLHMNSADFLRRRFDLADPTFDQPGDVDLIIGADHFFSLIGPSKYYLTSAKVWILESRLGWLISGGTACNEDSVVSVNTISRSDNLDDALEKFWSMEEVQIENSLTDEEARCEENFDNTTVRNDEGRYSVTLPFREPKIVLGDSFRAAVNRLSSLEKKFRIDPEFADKYRELMSLFEAKGYLELVPDACIDKPIQDRYYLPHYGITKSGCGTHKIRIVFDASVKSDNGVSLNDCILPGPKYQSDIFSLLLEFRLHEFVFVADIIKMYRQIQVNERDRDFQRIVWRRNEGEPMLHFRLTTLVDGVNAAPYLALRTMTTLAIDQAKQFPRGARALSYRYMDDFFVGDDSLDELIAIRDELIQILDSAGMCLDKWASNDIRILSGISEEKMNSEQEVIIESSGTMKTLGVIWGYRNDVFTFSANPGSVCNFTKRALLSESARIFDPCGWISPVTLLLKSLFQKTWLCKIAWDDPLPEGILTEWFAVRERLKFLSEVKIPRWIVGKRNVEIHGFCDSSNAAYAAVVYLRGLNKSGQIVTKLLASKTKLCSLKPVTIARLELCGAQLLAKLLRTMQSTLSNLKPCYYCWSDSKVVLAWLATNPSRWKSFVSNRCALIHEILPNVPWLYVKSEHNPADIASRGMLPDKLSKSELWWTGPLWLLQDWHSHFSVEMFETSSESCNIKVANVMRVEPFFIRFVERYSCFDRFRRAFSYFTKYLHFLKNRTMIMTKGLTSKDVSYSTELFIKLLQSHVFKNEIALLRDKKPILKSSKLSNLSPFLDESGLMRVGGRLSSAFMGFDARHPIILPHGHFLNILIGYIHVKYYHSGTKLTLALLKQNYFVSRSRSVVKSVISKCSVCMRFKGKTYNPVMSNLPEMRVNFKKPFEITGIDFAGPVMLRPYVGRGKITVKGYIAVMICMATRAVHLELVSSLSSEALIMALKRFLALYGFCKTMISDNGRNFSGCAKMLRDMKERIIESVESEDVKSYLLQNLLEWKFIPAYSPHFGGLWEAAVKSTKYHLSRMFISKTPTIEEMATVLAEIAAILNSRPLSSLTDDIDDLGVLTPSHLVRGSPAVLLPLLDTSLNDHATVKRYKEVGAIINLFWKQWQNEYLQDYLKRVKWKLPGRGPQVGDLVVIKRPNETPGHWLKARIMKLHPGNDGVVRVVEVVTGGGLRKEAVRNLVPLLLKHDASTGEYV